MHPNNLLQGALLMLAASMSSSHPCHNCRGADNVDDETAAKLDEVAEQQVIQSYEEHLKKRLLEALHLPNRPNVNATHQKRQFPAPLLAQMQGEEFVERPAYHNTANHRRHGHTVNSEPNPPREESYIFGESSGPCNSNKPTSCYKFHLQEQNNHAINLLSAELWVYKLEYEEDSPSELQTLVVRSAPRHHQHLPYSDLTSRIYASKQVQMERGWVRFDVSRLIRQRLGKPNPTFNLSVQCQSCLASSPRPAAASGVEKYQPFLVMSYETTNSAPEPSRQKRTAGGCRLRYINVNFHDLGLNDIAMPEGVNMSYCYGHCEWSPPSLPAAARNGRKPHANLMQFIARNRNDNSLLPCCAPATYSSMSLVYLRTGSGSSQYIKYNVSDLLATSCTCL